MQLRPTPAPSALQWNAQVSYTDAHSLFWLNSWRCALCHQFLAFRRTLVQAAVAWGEGKATEAAGDGAVAVTAEDRCTGTEVPGDGALTLPADFSHASLTMLRLGARDVSAFVPFQQTRSRHLPPHHEYQQIGATRTAAGSALHLVRPSCRSSCPRRCWCLWCPSGERGLSGLRLLPVRALRRQDAHPGGQAGTRSVNWTCRANPAEQPRALTMLIVSRCTLLPFAVCVCASSALPRVSAQELHRLRLPREGR
jgi:hypothetical protein